ncbi:hypothetical protein E2C01_030502 [Portunus trituberculatus]|uniref:Uncharacterized protein n=1 Tax=Portunus trituberculatus TaxID=210409 RepID=A0A5B7EVH1_PORTR|nr:hypothetical protein [Portunus trituberculatus]
MFKPTRTATQKNDTQNTSRVYTGVMAYYDNKKDLIREASNSDRLEVAFPPNSTRATTEKNHGTNLTFG